MFKKIALGAAVAFGLAGGAYAAGGGGHVENFDFPFDGPFGTYDTNQLQRGLQIYTEVCSACHGLKFVPLRTLADEGGPHLPEDQVRAYSEQFEVLILNWTTCAPASRWITSPYPHWRTRPT